MAAAAPVTIIRKIEVIEGGGHHGGAWKVAYADFMTAMMAFFLLMWILSSSDEQKLRGIAEYFTDATMPGGSGVLDGATLGPPGVLSASNGAVVARGDELGLVDDSSPAKWEVRDVTPTADPEEKVSGTHKGNHDNPAGGDAAETYKSMQRHDNDQDDNRPSNGGLADGAEANGAETNAEGDKTSGAVGQMRAEDNARFEQLHQELMQAIDENPDLRPLKKNVVFERTPEGLRIQIVDQKGQPMFASGSANLAAPMQKLMDEFGQSMAGLPNDMVISGHTDSVPFTSRRAYDNWDLSSDRANAMRRALLTSGVSSHRFIQVTGKADTEPLRADDPKHPSNRRITVQLNYQTLENKIAAATTPIQKPAASILPTPQAKPAQLSASTAPKQITQLDQKVFENLRNALR